MDKVLSVRVDDSVIQQVGMLARKRNTSKKAIVEAAIRLYSGQTGIDKKNDVFEKTSGAWRRSEIPRNSIVIARTMFNESMERHHR